MQVSRVAKLATVGVLTLVFVGGMWAASGAQNPLESRNVAVTVPSFNFGDRFEYDILYRERSNDFVPGKGTLTSHRLVHWDVSGPEVILNGDHRERAVVRIDATHQLVEGEDGNGDNLMELRYAAPLKSYIGLDNRAQVRLDWLYYSNVDPGAAPIEGSPLAAEWSGASLEVGPGIVSWPTRDLHWLVALLQGTTITHGQDLSADFAHIADTINHPGYEIDVRVAEQGLIDGVPVLGIQFVFHVVIADADYHEEEWENQTMWFSESSAVPLRIEFSRFSHWGTRSEGTYETSDRNGTAVLVGERRGSVPIQWGPVAHEESHPPVVETSDRPYPASGSKWRGDFRIEDAVASVASDPTLLPLRVWQMQNPDHRLVALEYWPRAPGVQAMPEDSWTWSMLFAAPNADTVMVARAHRYDSGAIVHEIPEADGYPVAPENRFDPAWLPSSFTVLSQADAFWEAMTTPETYEHGPNAIHWGPFPSCWANPECSPADALKVFSYGRTVREPLPPASTSPSATSRNLVRNDLAYMDASTGEALGGQFTAREPQFANPIAAALKAEDRDTPIAAPAPPRNLVTLAAGAASVSAVLLVLVYLFPLLQQGAIGLYTKLVKNQLLDHTLRDQLVQIIREHPGTSAPALKHMTSAGWSTVIYHLSVLKDNNLVTSVRDGRHRRYFLVGTMDHSSLQQAAILRNGRTQRILGLVAAQPGIERATLAKLENVTPAAVVWHLDRLVACGLVLTRKRGAFVTYHVARPDVPREVASVPA